MDEGCLFSLSYFLSKEKKTPMSTTEETASDTNSFDEAVSDPLNDDVSEILPAVKRDIESVNTDNLEKNWIVEDMSDASDEAKLERAIENAQNIFYKVLGRQWLDRHFVLAVKQIARMVKGGNPQSTYRTAIDERSNAIDAGYDNVVQFPSRRSHTTAEATHRLEGDPQPAPIDRSYASPNNSSD